MNALLLSLLPALSLLVVACAPAHPTSSPSSGSVTPENLASAGYRSLRAPRGFRVSVFSEIVKGARSLARGDQGTIFVGTMDDRVYALVDRDGDGRADEVHTIAKGLKMPNGVAFRKGALYVAEVSRILRFDAIESRLKNPPQPVVLRDDLPKETHHGWKFIAFGPDDKLYVPIGAPCNICNRTDRPYASILRMNPDGSGLEVFATGIRNTVGFTWHPETKELWFTDNGRDSLGDDVPPDELNLAFAKGMNFGYPFCHGASLKDPEFGQTRSCGDFTAPAWGFDAHVAALGLRFYTGSQFPAAYRGRLIVAQHGSWNRSKPIGYRLVSVALEGRKAVSSEVFIDGWLQGEKSWGRPVDVLVMPDGSLLVSDDEAGAIYRVAFQAS